MAVSYTDTPYNFSEIASFVVTEKDEIVSEIIKKQKCYFYDACSFRWHSNLGSTEVEYLLRYIKNQNGIIIITRCILMELASHSGVLNQEYVNYIKHINEFGIKVLLIYEEELFSVMEVCFSTNEAINNYLCWAVRIINAKSPSSTISETLEKNQNLKNEIIKGKNLDNSGVYKRFFKAVRENKELGDNLGEDVLGICTHVLSNIPAEDDGKFCIITDDKGAAGKFSALFKETAMQHKGKRVGIFSTPKLIQILYRENILSDNEHMKKIIETGTSGNIVVLGTLVFDLRNREISISKEELVDLIMKPNGINIVF